MARPPPHRYHATTITGGCQHAALFAELGWIRGAIRHCMGVFGKTPGGDVAHGVGGDCVAGGVVCVDVQISVFLRDHANTQRRAEWATNRHP